MTEAARLVDELTTLLYEVLKRWEVQGRVCEIVACGACRRKADKPESVVHEGDCPVYRLICAEASNTAVIRANAEEIADLEDVRDTLEAKVNALTAQMECRNELTARIRALEAEVKALREALEWYATESNYDVDDYDHEDAPGAMVNEDIRCSRCRLVGCGAYFEPDRGNRARAALATRVEGAAGASSDR